MKISVDQEALSSLAAKAATTARGGRGGGSAGALLTASGAGTDGSVRADATNGSDSIKSAITTTVHRDGACTVNAALLADMTRSLPSGTVELDLADNRLNISTGRIRFSLPILEADFPTLPSMPAAAGYVMTDLFTAAVKTVELSAAAVNGDGVHALKGLQVRSETVGDEARLRLTATDGRRLSTRTIPWTPNEGGSINAILPREGLDKALAVFSGEPTLGLAIDGSSVAGMFTRTQTLTTPVIAGSFPAWEPLVNITAGVEAVISRDAILAAATRMGAVSKFSTDHNGRGLVTCTFTAGELTLTTTANDAEAQDFVTASTTGGDITVVLNGAYLVAAVKSIDADEIRVVMTEATKPVLFTDKADSPHMRTVVMPIKPA